MFTNSSTIAYIFVLYGVVPWLFICFLAATTWQAITRRNGGRVRACWTACSAVMWAGFAGIIYFGLFPPQRFNADGHLVGEMPPEFGMACVAVELASCVALLGFAVKWISHIHRRRRSIRAG